MDFSDQCYLETVEKSVSATHTSILLKAFILAQNDFTANQQKSFIKKNLANAESVAISIFLINILLSCKLKPKAITG